MSVARKKAPIAVLPTPPATAPVAVAPAPSTLGAVGPAQIHAPVTPIAPATTTARAPTMPTTIPSPITPLPTPIQPIQPKPLQPIQAQPILTPKLQPTPLGHTQPATTPIPIQPNTTATNGALPTYQNIQTLNFQVNGAPQTIAPSQLLPGSPPVPQTQKQLRTQKPKATQQAQAAAQKPRKQKTTKRAVKRAPPTTAATQPILPRPAKGRTKITAEEIQLVQSLIERCLQLYMNQTEVITALHLQANIEPSFTSLVWLKLEEQNPDFFKAYHIRLRIKEQITAFNYLVSQQAQLMVKAGTFVPTGLNQAGAASQTSLPQQPLSPLVGSPTQSGSYLPPYAPLPQLPSLQALAQTTSSGISTTHPTPIAPRVTQPNRNPTLSPQTNSLLTQTTTTFVPSMPVVDNMPYNFGSTAQTTSTLMDELKDDTPITEDIDTNQFFLSES